jgi:hypothetical protein
MGAHPLFFVLEVKCIDLCESFTRFTAGSRYAPSNTGVCGTVRPHQTLSELAMIRHIKVQQLMHDHIIH